MRKYSKRDFPVWNVRRFLEPGPIVLVSSAWKGRTNIMTMGWHTVIEFQPSLVACVISEANHSFAMIRKSRECVINLPTVEIAETVVRIGNSSGRAVDKFAAFGLTPRPGSVVRAPAIAECYASFECRLADAGWVQKYNLFIFEVVKAHVATSPRFPKTLHYRGDGLVATIGPTSRRLRRLFRSELLD
jgi:flavin reductase (DIM6/NTAB) family NADH-FMN oxidoreductase RutF